MTTADISLFLKYNDLKREEIQTSQSKQNSLTQKLFQLFCSKIRCFHKLLSIRAYPSAVPLVLCSQF